MRNPSAVVAKRRLGRTDLEVTPIGLGAWQFSQGRGLAGSYWPALAPQATDEIVRAALAGGINWFDTAEIYGNGRSEQALARGLRAAGVPKGEVAIATKWWPVPRTAASIQATIGARLRCLDGYPIDLYQVHQPYSFSTVEDEMAAMADLVRAGQIRAVGVSNFSASQMRRAHDALARRGLPLASNQVKYSLLDRRVESNGILAAARDLGITLIAYSPLEQGLLTGRFHRDPEQRWRVYGVRKWLPWFWRGALERSRPLIETLEAAGEAHGVSAAEVALNWLVHFHGDLVVAIAGATKPEQVASNAGALRFTLGQDELSRIDEASRRARRLGLGDWLGLPGSLSRSPGS